MILCIGTTPAAQRVMVFLKVVSDAVNRATKTFDGAAGKSVNVAKVLKALGENPVAIGFLGGDRGAHLKALLEGAGMELDFVDVGARTRQCTTVIDESAGTQTELVEESSPVAASDYQKLTGIIQRRVKNCRAAVMSGTLTPGGPTDFYFKCAEMANQAGALSIVDAQGAPLIESLKARPVLVKPNRGELAATLGRELRDDAALISGMRELHGRGAQRIVVTAGKAPTLAFDGESFWRILMPSIRAVNPIGSGDAFTAGLVWRLLRGEELGEACRWGAAAGAANALTIMAGDVNRADVERLASDAKVEKFQA
jgi:tagatose 6-phosphate kinase